jgi:hypothetical protein
MHLEHPAAEQYAHEQRRHYGPCSGDDQARPARLQALDEIGAGVEADDGHEAREADRLEYPQRRARDAAQVARARRAQPAGDEASEQHADRHAETYLDSRDVNCRQPDQGPGHDRGRDD